MLWWAWLLSVGSDRLLRDVVTAALIVADYLAVSRSGVEDWTAVHQRSAERILRLCEVNRGIYIKLGQHVAQMEYMLPLPYVEVLKATLRQAPVSSFDEVRQILLEELGEPPERFFRSLSPTPIASASLAQVHVAHLHDGRKVAVKVQHAGLREASEVDVRTIEAIVDLVRRLFPKFEYTWLVEEIKRNLPLELNFEHEAKNMNRCREVLAAHAQVAVPHPLRATKRVLVMEFMEGVYIDDVAAIRRLGLDPAEVAHIVSEAFNDQIFRHGFVHCDPHAGNLLVRPAARGRSWAEWLRGRAPPAEVVLLDHGLYRELPEATRLTYAELWRALIFKDEPTIKACAERLNAGALYRLLAAVLTMRSWDHLMEPELDSIQQDRSTRGKLETRRHAKEYADGIQEILRQIPREIILLLKTNDCLRAIDTSLGSPMNTFLVTARYCTRALREEERKRNPGWGTWLRTAYSATALEVGLQAFQFGAWASSLGRRPQREAPTAADEAGGEGVAITTPPLPAEVVLSGRK